MEFNDVVDTNGEVKKKSGSLKTRVTVILVLLLIAGGLAKFVYFTWQAKSESVVLGNQLKVATGKVSELEKKIGDVTEREQKSLKESSDKNAQLEKEIADLREQTKAFAVQAKACAVLQQKLKS